MRILVYGAGVLGSLYAARLQDAGADVTVLARGQRLADIQTHGIVLEDALSETRTVARVAAVDRLNPDDAYDLIIVLVRKNQVAGVLPALAANRATPNILMMVNNASGYEAWAQAIGRHRLLTGFAGAGGAREGHVVSYVMVPGLLQPTTLGEADGRMTPRLRQIADKFRAAGFPVATSKNMDAWQKTHVAWIGPVAYALYLAGGSNYRLARTPDGLVLLVRAVREGFAVLRARGVPVIPARLLFWQYTPEPLLVAVLSRVLATRFAEIVVSRHTVTARDEIAHVAGEFKALAQEAGVATPATDALAQYIDPAFPEAPTGSAALRIHWEEAWIALALALASVGALGAAISGLRGLRRTG